MSDNIQKILKKLEGKPIKYSELCEELEWPKKTGNSKISQMNELKLYCNIEKVPGSAKYIIHKTYSSPNSPLSAGNRYQIYFEHAIQSALKKESTLYLSHTQLLSALYLIDDNFKILNNVDNRSTLLFCNHNFFGENIMKIANGILYQWANRRMQKMCQRGFIDYTDGYCLIKEIEIAKNRIKISNNVMADSDLGETVKKCYETAYDTIFPKRNKKSFWVPSTYQTAFSLELKTQLKECIGNEYIGAYATKVIISKQTIVDNLRNSDVKKILNNEAMKKISETKQLNELTGFERDRFVSELIKLNPEIDYQEILRQAEKKQKQEYKRLQKEYQLSKKNTQRD